MNASSNKFYIVNGANGILRWDDLDPDTLGEANPEYSVSVSITLHHEGRMPIEAGVYQGPYRPGLDAWIKSVEEVCWAKGASTHNDVRVSDGKQSLSGWRVDSLLESLKNPSPYKGVPVSC